MGLRSDPYGFVVCDERDHTLQVCVHPDHRKDGVAYQLLTEALGSYPDYTIWAFGTLPGTHELAAQLRLEPVRELYRMERALDAPTGPEPTADGYTIAPYTPPTGRPWSPSTPPPSSTIPSRGGSPSTSSTT
ncbi:hypothetical protein G7085_15030 [Tessaracoccus sp. HDW20]|uniref:hypothetical protein n=1 Tax=Tessaracoccus coleopterorum TaxID=2714950 RepID=UPI0018D2F695|nr:hypothetical protein [Tessaracoccus coleopterorum]NHB85489.1 hypothetical protein [Tessaracoccus coleopterorum]